MGSAGQAKPSDGVVGAPTEPTVAQHALAGCDLVVATWGSGPPEIVMLHDGLGSIGQWRTVPSQVAALTGQTVVAYERAGHGASKPAPEGAWPADWLHREAKVLAELLDELGVEHPVIVGHSDGGSIALIHACQAGRSIAGVLAMAPHSWVEDICYDAIVAMRANSVPIVFGLSRHHNEPQAVFEAWSGAWVSDEFRTWDIRPLLSTIQVPTVIAQGRDDAYATADQALLTAAAVGPNAQARLLDGLGHILHHDDADRVAELIASFALRVARQDAESR